MPTLKELSDKVDELQSTIDTEQEQIAAATATLNQTILDLQAIIDAGNPANEAEIQAILDKVNTAIADLQSTVA